MPRDVLLEKVELAGHIVIVELSLRKPRIAGRVTSSRSSSRPAQASGIHQPRLHRPVSAAATQPVSAPRGRGFDLHYYGLDGHDPATSHSTCGVIVDDTKAIWESFAAGLRSSFGRLAIARIPRITRPRPRKNASGSQDPRGADWARHSRTQSCWRLRGAVRRATADDRPFATRVSTLRN